jgi:hypothetical protein
MSYNCTMIPNGFIGICLRVFPFILVMVNGNWVVGQTVYQKSVTAYGLNLLRPTHDGGFITTGAQGCLPIGDFDISISKIDSAFNVQWSAKMGNTKPNSCRSLIQSSDHGYVLVGYSSEVGVPYRVSAMKLDSNGVIQWVKAFDFSQISAHSFEVIEATDGGYLIVGNISGDGGDPDIFLLKLSSNGLMQWNKRYDTGEGEGGWRIFPLSNGGFMIGGEIQYDSETVDVFLMQVNAQGYVVFFRAYDGPGRFEFVDMIRTYDGGYALLGYTRFTGSELGEFLLLKLTSSATVHWSRIYKHFGNDQPRKLVQLPDSGYVMVGGSHQLYLTGNADPFAIRTDEMGELLWAREYGGNASQEAVNVLLSPDGGLLIGAATFNSAPSGFTMLIKTDLNGYSGCEQDDPEVSDSSFVMNYSSLSVQSANTFVPLADPVYTSNFCIGAPNVTICEVPSSPLSATASQTNATCFGASDGSAIVVGGMPSYSYLWNTDPPQTTAIATGLMAGQYTCTVTDTTGTYMTLTVTIAEPPSIAISLAAPIDTLICPGDSLVLTVIGGAGLDLQWHLDGDTLAGATSQSFMPLSNGIYHVVATQPNTGCSVESNSVTVTFESAEDVTITQVGNLLTSTSAESYQWFLNGVLINGATSQSYTISSSGIYSVAVVTALGCIVYSNLYELTYSNIEESLNRKWSIWPNPSTGFFHLLFEQDDDVYLTISDIVGQEVHAEHFTAISKCMHHIDLSGRAYGVYLLNIETQDGISGVRIMKH